MISFRSVVTAFLLTPFFWNDYANVFYLLLTYTCNKLENYRVLSRHEIGSFTREEVHLHSALRSACFSGGKLETKNSMAFMATKFVITIHETKVPEGIFSVLVFSV